jgi:hypothetical protein
MPTDCRRCTHKQDVSELSDFDKEVWQCPYQRHADGKCLFHLPISDKSDAEVTEALLTVIHDPESLRVVNADNPSTLQPQWKLFIGGQFGQLDLSHTLLDPDDNQPLDFRKAEFHGNIDASYLECRSPVWFDDATIQRTAVFDEAVFEKEVRFNDTIFRSDVSFFDTQFKADAHFTEVSFNSLVTFHAANFTNDAKFTDAWFSGHAKFSRVTFERRAQFGRSLFSRRTRFNGASFHSTALFDDAMFRDVVSFLGARFAEDARFNGAQFSASTLFETVRFDGEFSFVGGEISDSMTFEAARFDRGATLTGGLDGDLSMKDAAFEDRLDIQDLNTDEQTLVQLQGTTIPKGSLVCSTTSSHPVVYDLRDARIGNIDLIGGNRLDIPLFNNLLLEQTEFDGFDFADYIDELTTVNWTLHTDQENSLRRSHYQRLVPAVLQNPFELAGSELTASERASQYATYEGTYLRAKNGAKQVGFSRAAANFFIRELTYRRRKAFWQMMASERPSSFQAAYQWVASLLLGGTSGYGERPSYVIITSALLIVGFGAAYNILVPDLYPEALSSLSLSLGAFVTLLLGSPGSINEYPLVSALAHLEGILGAFLIALFVFTLTRSLHR